MKCTYLNQIMCSECGTNMNQFHLIHAPTYHYYITNSVNPFRPMGPEMDAVLHSGFCPPIRRHVIERFKPAMVSSTIRM
ncbi:hypothetical protein KC19_VG219800 [Ceratodon purpureus]|uniref:Uncharacterized protein n=1 Tax=Ceratodon purpureus TaxID=3225 RepID=A0A8T0HT17_CERPU|nr:hypothetical protein KC19_VG219800 [Ceratodon purpureus]